MTADCAETATVRLQHDLFKKFRAGQSDLSCQTGGFHLNMVQKKNPALGGGLWTLSCDFAHTINKTLK